MEEKNIFQDFADDLTFLMEKDHISIIIPSFSMWAEYVVNLLVKQKLGSKLKNDHNFTFSLKLQVLRKLDIIAESEFKTLNALREARNLLLHNGVEMDRKKFDTLLDKVELNTQSKDMNKEWKKKVPLNTRFFYACFSKIYYLLQKSQNDFSYNISISGGKAYLEKTK